jgi:hypothetical protein
MRSRASREGAYRVLGGARAILRSMGLLLRRVTWDERPDPALFTARLSARLEVEVKLHVRAVDPPLPGDEAIDTAIDFVSPRDLVTCLDAQEWGPRGGRVLCMLGAYPDDLSGAVILALVELGAHFEGERRPTWQGTLAEIRARHTLIAKLRRWLGREPG